MLRPYVKHYFLFQSAIEAAVKDVVFPTGSMEVIFNLGNDTWETFGENSFRRTPSVELWGQITRPLALRMTGQQTLLGIAFFTHSARGFFNEGLDEFNDRVHDLYEVLGNPVKTLHAQLLEARETKARIALVEQFLLKRLGKHDKKNDTIQRVGSLLASIEGAENRLALPTEHTLGLVAAQHGISSRYLHKLVQQHTGLSPREFRKIRRFQASLRLLVAHEQPLTAVAHACGYFDQSHFIRDFRAFTGLTPSAYRESGLLLHQFFID